jgi:site-specific DNA-methyltransferase (adenine-specific)
MCRPAGSEAKNDRQEWCGFPAVVINKLPALYRGVQNVPVSNRNRSPGSNGTAATIAAPSPLQGDSVRIYHARFQNLEQVAGLKPGSAQLILTDPPYSRDWLPQWDELAALAARLLAVGGLFVTYSGKYYLRHVMAWLDKHLTYQWVLASCEDETGSRFDARQVMGFWKPVLLYSNGPWMERDWWDDVLRAPKEKTYHPCQQPIEEAEQLLSYFSNPGDLVIDPCAGSFTVAEACLRLGRRCVSCDSESWCVSVGETRLAKAGEVQHAG